mmetsp:Transcript_44549/g.49678  ORF Transcript_44549/g.49678 Transcript_44549/m.49678 type:complete len:88 (-) Transcript_44549:18-281(-)
MYGSTLVCAFGIFPSANSIPLIGKITAIKKVCQSATKFKRITIQLRQLFITVGIFNGVVVLYLLFWTIFDPSTVQTISTLTDNFDEE